MGKHLGKRERLARKRKRRSGFTHMDFTGTVTLKVGPKKFLETMRGNLTSDLLKKKFRGCVVDAER